MYREICKFISFWRIKQNISKILTMFPPFDLVISCAVIYLKEISINVGKDSATKMWHKALYIIVIIGNSLMYTLGNH